MSAYRTGAEDLLVGRILHQHGIMFSSDWRFRQSPQPWNWPLPRNMIITSHQCRLDEMTHIHKQAAGIVEEEDPSTNLFAIKDWSTDYGMLGLEGRLGFRVDGRDEIRGQPIVECSESELNYISAHANSQVVIDARRPLTIFGFMDSAARHRPRSAVSFLVDGHKLGTLAGHGPCTSEIQVNCGVHQLEARCEDSDNLERRYSVWALYASLRP